MSRPGAVDRLRAGSRYRHRRAWPFGAGDGITRCEAVPAAWGVGRRERLEIYHMSAALLPMWHER